MSAIANYAKDLAAQFKARQTGLQDEISRLQAQLRSVEMQLRDAHMAADRGATFVEHRDGRLQCPSCWVTNEVAADLVPVPSDDRDDVFRCHECGLEFDAPAS